MAIDYSYQDELLADISAAWANGAQNVLLQLPTGGGKTQVFCRALLAEPGESVAIAHRKELVTQMSCTLAGRGVKHRIIGADDTLRDTIARHHELYGQSFFDPSARTTCASVDTLLARHGDGQSTAWATRQRLVVVDEGHHVLRGNKWGEALALFPNARGLLPTACPERADGQGLARSAAGVVDAMVQGPTMRDLINRGALSEYRIVCPKPSIDLDLLRRGSDGDFTLKSLAAESRRNIDKIVGDAVSHYLQHTPGKRGMCFTTDITTAHDIAAAFNAAGVPAMAVSSRPTPGDRNARDRAIRGLRDGSVLMVVNVDLFGEGTDVPLLEVVIMARKTDSLNIYLQQFGRVLRVAEGKAYGYVIDMVGNVLGRHGLPDIPRQWNLNGRTPGERRARDDSAPPLTVCKNETCCLAYSRELTACPYCGHVPAPLERSSVKAVDGELMLLDGEVLQGLRDAAARANRTPQEVMDEMTARRVPRLGVLAAGNRQRTLLAARGALTYALAQWAAKRRQSGISDAESHRALWLRFGVDVLTAQTLPLDATERLIEGIERDTQP